VITAITLGGRRALALAALVALGVGLSVWRLQGGAAAPEDVPTAAAAEGDIVVSVGGVGRMIQAKASGPIATPSPTGTGAAASGSASSSSSGEAPAGAVFPRTSGRVSRLLVGPGEVVAAGQPLARLDDGGAAAAAVKQAQNDLATAQLELRQKRTSDPLASPRATPEELEAGRVAVTSARERLERLLGSPREADVSAAMLDVKRAEGDLETLRGGSPADRANAVRIARRNVELAENRLELALAPADPADVSAANAELKKAEADLAALLRPPNGPLPEEIDAARRAVTVARENLADAQAAVPPDPAVIRAAELELDRALADLAVLLRAPQAPLAEEIASAREAVEAARAKVAKLLRPANSADAITARMELERARAELQKLQAGPSRAALAAARQAVDSARAKLAQLLGPPLQSDVTAAQLDVERAEADLALLEARGGPATPNDIGLAQLKADAARARLDIAHFDAGLLTVRALSAGTVTALLSVPGAPVDTSTPVLTVADLDSLAVSVDLSEFDVAQVRPGQKAVVKVDALGGKSFPGTVLFAAPTGTDTGGVVTFPVRVGLARTGGLRPGMNVSVRITVARRSDVVQVPLEAVSQEDGESTVEILDDAGEPTSREVTLGLANNKNVEVVKGLRAGERVVLPEQAPEEEAPEEEE
jgi:HlyD family secretion protein